jgi:ABC-type transport system involved in multi-copper enzyme maturation permease subunit
MGLQLAQISAIVRYETKLLWRARIAPIVLLLLLALSVTNVLSLTTTGRVTLDSMLRNYDQVGAVIFFVWSPLGSALALLLPLIVADTIPRDKHYGVWELLQSLPLGSGSYLTGKIVGVCSLLLVGVWGIALIAGLLWSATLGTYDPAPYLHMVIFGIGSLIVMNGGLGVLLTATQPTRRRAIAIVIFMLVIPAMLALDNIVGIKTLAGMLLPTRRVILLHYLQMPQPQLYTAIIVGLVELVIAWLLVRAWLNWRSQTI